MSSFKERITRYIENIDVYLLSKLPIEKSPPNNLHKAMHYSVMNGGKRIRPLLTFACAESVKVDPKILIPAAASIELLHCFSLVHDDLPCMDDDDLRRGKPSTHKEFGEATAILAADALLSLSFEILASDLSFGGTALNNGPLISLISNATGSKGITGGQQLDLNAEENIIGQSELEHVYRQKTGKLLRACILAPTCFSDISLEQLSALEIYADSIGLAFQIKDDILEVEGSTQNIGKSSKSDIKKGKATFPKIFGLDASKNRMAELLRLAKNEISVFGKDAHPLKYMAESIINRKL
tara:strand:- start:263 stop:1153 length:891 start_codon:yes stop_codon:yes gene_type:complete